MSLILNAYKSYSVKARFTISIKEGTYNMVYEQIIKNIIIIEEVLFFIIVIVIIALIARKSIKSIFNTTINNLTDKKKRYKKQNHNNKKRKQNSSVSFYDNTQKPIYTEPNIKPAASFEVKTENKRINKIMNTLQEEEMMKQKVLEKYFERYTVEGRESITKSKIVMEEESKILKKDQIQKVRNRLLSDKEKDITNFEFKSNTAMVIDDNQFSINILKRILKEINIEVVGEKNSGLEAIELVEQLKPEFVFMDIKMSDIDGITAAKLIIRKLPKAIIIVCSNHCDDNILACLEDINVKGFIQKPFTKENVVEVIKEIKKMLL